MLYAGEFLDQKPVQQAAANAVMNIALGNKEYMGANVRTLLNKVMEVLDNPDAGYQREAIKKHLAEMPQRRRIRFFVQWQGFDRLERRGAKPDCPCEDEAGTVGQRAGKSR